MRGMKSFLLAAIAALMAVTVSAQVPHEIKSPKGTYLIKMLDKPLPGSGSDGDYTIVLYKKGKALAKMPTIGYLMSAEWSADGKFVAVNNRRGNSGDYVWIFALETGQVIKKPDDATGEKWQKDAGKAITAQHPKLTEENLNRDWVTATGWKDGKLQFTVRKLYFKEGSVDYNGICEGPDWGVSTGTLSEFKVVK